jgi:hypothetical protein
MLEPVTTTIMATTPIQKPRHGMAPDPASLIVPALAFFLPIPVALDGDPGGAVGVLVPEALARRQIGEGARA